MARWTNYFRTAEWVISLIQQLASLAIAVLGVLFSETLFDISLSQSIIIGSVSALVTCSLLQIGFRVMGTKRKQLNDLPLDVRSELARNRQRFWHDFIEGEAGGIIIIGSGTLIFVVVIAVIVYVFDNFSKT